MAFKQYTHCVQRDEFDALGFASFAGPALVVIAGVVAIVAFGPPGVFVAAIGLLWGSSKACHFLLGGKLICLGGDRCVIGRVVQLEPVGFGKSGPELIDNDFAVNLLLAPHPPTATKSEIEGDDAQGELIARKSPELNGLDLPGYNPVKLGSVEIPVFHTEFEGSRIHDVCEAIPWALAALSIGAAICAIPVVGWIVCVITLVAGAAIATTILAAAWTGAEGGNPKDAEVRPGDGDLQAMNADLSGGDYVVIVGTWCYDSGHTGWNELHPAKSVQKIPRTWTEGSNPPEVEELRKALDTWCGLVAESKHPLVIAAQGRAENRWGMHPALDGCRPRAAGEGREGSSQGSPA